MVDIAWREEKNRRYASDAVYPQSDGVEQVSFDQVSGAHHARPQKVLTRLRAGVKPALRGKVFDIGCGNSALLRDRGSGDPHRAIEGLSRNTQSQTLTEAIPGVTKLHVESLDRIQIRSDLIALILAVEHFPETVQHLKTLAKHLNPGGGVLFEVPGLESSPFDILIADHCTQFNLNTFKARIEAARLLTLTLSFGHAANELPLLVRSVVTPGPIIQANPDVAGGAVTSRPIAWLQAVLTRGRAAPAPQGG